MSGAELACPAPYHAPVATDRRADPFDEELREIFESDPAFHARLERLSQQIGQSEVTGTLHEQVIRRFGLAEESDADGPST